MGHTLLGYTEKEVWRMTLRKLLAIWKEYCRFYGLKPEKPEDTIPEDVI